MIARLLVVVAVALAVVVAVMVLGGCAVAGIPHPSPQPSPQPAAWTPTGEPPDRSSVAMALLFAGQWFVIPKLGVLVAEHFRRPGRPSVNRYPLHARRPGLSIPPQATVDATPKTATPVEGQTSTPGGRHERF